MEIHGAEFISSITHLAALPEKQLPEFAFIGRSNVGKSSLINMLTRRKQLAKTSNKPGKTQTINHFLINDAWYLVDLPGYGYASVSKDVKSGFGKIIENYVTKSKNLYCLFILVDIRLKPQPIDLSFINWAGSKEVPIVLVFTKVDKLSKTKALHHRQQFEQELLMYWEELPPVFMTSAEKKTGRKEVLEFIHEALPAKR
jgi:GTP-binding protein